MKSKQCCPQRDGGALGAIHRLLKALKEESVRISKTASVDITHHTLLFFNKNVNEMWISNERMVA